MKFHGVALNGSEVILRKNLIVLDWPPIYRQTELYLTRYACWYTYTVKPTKFTLSVRYTAK